MDEKEVCTVRGAISHMHDPSMLQGCTVKPVAHRATTYGDRRPMSIRVLSRFRETRHFSPNNKNTKTRRGCANELGWCCCCCCCWCSAVVNAAAAASAGEDIVRPRHWRVMMTDCFLACHCPSLWDSTSSHRVAWTRHNSRTNHDSQFSRRDYLNIVYFVAWHCTACLSI